MIIMYQGITYPWDIYKHQTIVILYINTQYFNFVEHAMEYTHTPVVLEKQSTGLTGTEAK